MECGRPQQYESSAVSCVLPVLRCQRTTEPTVVPTQCRQFLGRAVQHCIVCPAAAMMAQVTGLKAGDFVHTLGDTHIYLNHLEQVDLQLTREPRPLPQMRLNPDVKNIFDFKFEDFELVNYDPWPHIAGAVSV